MWLNETSEDVSDPKQIDRSRARVVEISPRVLVNHKSWTQNSIQKLIDQGARVRISGWLTWDEEHPEQITNKIRGTLWEVHPIHKIEVLTGGKWVEL